MDTKAYESYKQIIQNADVCIRPGKRVNFSFDGSTCLRARRLFLTGETNISPYWKTEPDYKKLSRRIDDSLRSDLADRDRFCLDYSGVRCPYPKIAFKKFVAPFQTPMFVLNDSTDEWSFGIKAKACNLRIYGYLRVCVEIRLKKENVGKHSTAGLPDAVFTLDIPEGSYDWQEFSQNITFDHSNIANVCYFLEGVDYEGEIYLEAPRFSSASGHNLAGQFLPHTEDRKTVNWIGQNLSRIEWIGLRVELNGKTVFDGEIFERCHRFSEAELILPPESILPGENTITFTCTSDYRDAAGYHLREWGFITEKESFVVAAPESITVGQPFFVCVEGQKGDVVALSSDTVVAIGDLILQQDGLNALAFVCHTPANGISFTLNEEKVTISRCVEREEDGVITGTGDMVYISIDKNSVTNYLKWYFSQNIGNLLTIRPTYRWNGTRIFNFDLYRQTANLLDAMGIHYSHMLDGRDLPGCNGNPTVSELDTPHFLGRQTHELDGQFAYWGIYDVTNNLSEQMFYDLFLRIDRSDTERMHMRHIPENIHYTETKQHIFRSPEEPTDMKSAAERFLRSLKNTRRTVLRHTGPSTLFKYFYQAGYRWVGAELMYSPTELTASALRGARNVYGGKTGAHLAVQWSTSPHDTESRYRRYRLALFICYMQGIDEINTEEGLWHLEEYYHFHHRFSEACQNHTRQQQDLFRYISTHTRSGRFYTPIAFLSGRYDGWKCFGRDRTWGINSFGFSDAEAAWDLLTEFYPKSVLDRLYVHNCPDKELGYYSGTPNGNVDILPVEAADYSKYRLLIMIGYHKAEEEDAEKLASYLHQGGTLMLGWPQLSVTTERKDVVTYSHSYCDKKERHFTDDTYCSYPVRICEDVTYDAVLVYTDSGKPLITIQNHGNGRVCFVNAKEYAGAPAVALACRKAIELLTEECLAKEKIYARGNRNVQFSVFEKENGGRDIYFIATDWHKPDPDGEGTLILGNDTYSIPVPWGQLVKVAAYSNSALYPIKDENEVIAFDGGTARVQGTGVAEFVLCQNGRTETVTVDFSERSVREITLR